MRAPDTRAVPRSLAWWRGDASTEGRRGLRPSLPRREDAAGARSRRPERRAVCAVHCIRSAARCDPDEYGRRDEGSSHRNQEMIQRRGCLVAACESRERPSARGPSGLDSQQCHSPTSGPGQPKPDRLKSVHADFLAVYRTGSPCRACTGEGRRHGLQGRRTGWDGAVQRSATRRRFRRYVGVSSPAFVAAAGLRAAFPRRNGKAHKRTSGPVTGSPARRSPTLHGTVVPALQAREGGPGKARSELHGVRHRDC